MNDDGSLTCAFGPLQPYGFFDDTGERTGFGAELKKQAGTLSDWPENTFKDVVLGQDMLNTGVARHPGFGVVRERLIGACTGYVLSGTNNAIQPKYFKVLLFWAQSRVTWLLLGLAALTLFTTAATIAFAMRSRARALAAVQIAIDELETIFNAASSGIIALDRNGMVVRVNDRARHFLGGVSMPVPFDWPPEITFLDPGNLQPLESSKDPIQRASVGAEPRHCVHLMTRTSDGHNPRYVRLKSATLKSDQTDIRSVIVLDDVSSEERNRQVVERKGRLEALGHLTGGIAHDFNNLLTTFLSSIFLAGRAKDAAQIAINLEDAEAAVARARSLTSRLMAFAKRQPGLAESANIGQTMDGFFSLVRPMLEETITLKIVLEDRDLLVFCENAQLESALLNLVLNSRDAILREGIGNEITVIAKTISTLDHQDTLSQVTSPASRFVELSVTDNGPGMDEHTVARATDPFFTTKDTNSGTGLGLSMVYGFARQADGDLRIYSEIGVGTTVKLTLPRGTSNGGRETQMRTDEIVMGNGQTILLVEDELELLKAASNLLSALNYKVVSANSGAKALELVQKGKMFDLLLTDVVMPGDLGGFRLAEAVTAFKPDVPVIYFSGYTGFSASEMGKVTGLLLQKPATPSEMSRAIASALSQED